MLSDKTDLNDNIFTDGIGMISQKEANKIFDIMRSENFLIRKNNLVPSLLHFKLVHFVRKVQFEKWKFEGEFQLV